MAVGELWDGEEWRAVASAPDYAVSSLGRVRRITPKSGTAVGRVLKAKVQKKGHHYVILAADDGAITRNIHRLVAEAFIGERPSGMLVLHRDDNKSNNALSNLYYGTYRDNVADAVRNGTFAPGRRKDGAPRISTKGRKPANKTPTAEQVREIRRIGTAVSCVRIAARVGTSKSTVHRILTGEAYADVV